MGNDDAKEKMDAFIEKTKVIANQAGKKAGEIASAVGEKAEEIWDATKKKIAIEKLEYKINKAFKKLGKEYYESVKNGIAYTDNTLVEEINQMYQAIDDINADKQVDIDIDDDENEDE